jgi:CheY-like chemotaxis protein
MAPEVRDRVFEPFFTTKEVGKGSGLGLSQVYGFVRQSDGEVRLDSEVGLGSTFCLRLPLSADVAAQDPRPAVSAGVVTGGDERILLVEDDPRVLALTLDLLAGLGYQVTCASNAAEALDVLKADAKIDLLFSDVVMPGGVSGVTLARTARELIPDLAVLLTSGFMGDGSVAEVEFPLLDKPYETPVMAAKLRALLDARAAAPPVRRDWAAAE